MLSTVLDSDVIYVNKNELFSRTNVNDTDALSLAWWFVYGILCLQDRRVDKLKKLTVCICLS